MQQLNSSYAQCSNGRHGRSGHLFGGRFKAILIQREPHLLEVARYIVLNPARSSNGASHESWPWSSYRATAGIDAAPAFLSTAAVLAHFGRRRGAAERAYAVFVRAGLEEGAPLPIRAQIYLGDDSFIRSRGGS